MKVRRTIPPAAAPVSTTDIVRGMAGMLGNGGSSKLEDGIRTYFGSEYVFLVSSGKAALSLILKGLSSLRPRKKVVIPAYTCYSVPSAVLNAGLEIVLCDVDPDTLDFDFGQLERLVDEDILCTVPTHLFGIPSDVDRVRRICEERGIFVVEDAAQGMGVVQDGRKLGTLGDVGFFSLGRGKNITCGSGGIILTSSREISENISKFHRDLRKEPFRDNLKGIAEIILVKLFLNPFLYWFPKGLPFLGIGETRFSPEFPICRLSNFRTGVLDSWQARMEGTNRQRSLNGIHFLEKLALRKEKKIYSRELPFLRFPVYADTPECKVTTCKRYGYLGFSPMYPGSVNQIEQLREMFAGTKYAGAERIAATLMTLPTHGYLTEGDRARICDRLECGVIGEETKNVSVPVDRYAGKDLRKLRR